RVALDRDALSHRAHPRRRPAAEAEQILPGDEAPGAPDRERGHLAEQPLEACLAAWRSALDAGAVHVVRLLERRERLHLQAAAGVVLVEHLAALEGHLVAGGRVGQGG